MDCTARTVVIQRQRDENTRYFHPAFGKMTFLAANLSAQHLRSLPELPDISNACDKSLP
jgi:hypothetical protein